MRIFSRISFLWLAVISLAAVMTGCVQELAQEQNYGYVQFRLYKSGSFPGVKASGGVLDSLYEASKVKVTLRSEDNKSLNPTVPVMKVDASIAEFGIQTEKFLLEKGTYTVTSYTVYNGTDEQIFSGEPAETTEITVVGGGLSVQNLSIATRARGFVKFRLIPQPSDRLDEEIKNQKPSRALAAAEIESGLMHPFYNIKSADVTVTPVGGGSSKTFRKLPASHEFADIDGTAINVCTLNSLVPVEAGRYRVTALRIYFDKDGKVFEDNKNIPENEFIVKDNQVTGLGDGTEDEELRNADVRVTLNADAGYIRDALALRKIWLDHNGPDWEKNGVQVLWNFDGDVNVWLAQPGVQVSENGRVAVIDFSGTGVSGKLSDAIGELTEIRRMSFGTHSYFPTPKTNTISGTFDPDLLERERNAAPFIRTFFGNVDPLVEAFGTSPEILECLEKEKGLDLRRDQTPSRILGASAGESWKPGSEDKPYASYVTELPDAINNLKNLQLLYISYCAMQKLPEDLSGLESLTDIEFYNCYDMEEFPVGVATLPKLISFTFSSNTKVAPEKTEEGLRRLNDGASAERLQILQLPNQRINTVPDLTGLVRISLLNMTQCGIDRFETAFGKEHPFVTFNVSNNNLRAETLPRDANGFFIGFNSETESVDFSHNKFNVLPNIFNAKSVFRPESISFAYNEIEDVEDGDSFRGINAVTLNLSGNRLAALPKQILNTGSKISFLQLSRNGMEKITDEALEGENVKIIQIMDLSNNKLEKLPDSFNSRTMHYLEQLDLSYNRFAEFPFAAVNSQYMLLFIFRGQRDAEGNRCMKTWPNGIGAGLYRLRGLYLGSNDIGKVTDNQISHLCYNLDISDNPNITINLSNICPYLMAGQFNLIYTPGQDIRGCDILRSDK